MTDSELRALAERAIKIVPDSRSAQLARALIEHLDFCEARVPKRKKIKKRDRYRPAPENG